MKIISNPKPIPVRSQNQETIVSDKSMKEIHEKFVEMEAEGGLKIVRSSTYAELSKLPQDQLYDTERAMLMYYRTLDAANVE